MVGKGVIGQGCAITGFVRAQYQVIFLLVTNAKVFPQSAKVRKYDLLDQQVKADCRRCEMRGWQQVGDVMPVGIGLLRSGDAASVNMRQ